jgi:hypothetical protein
MTRKENAGQGLTRRPRKDELSSNPDEGEPIACQMLALGDFAGIGLVSPGSPKLAAVVWRGEASNLPVRDTTLRRGGASNMSAGAAAGVGRSAGYLQPLPPGMTVRPTMTLQPVLVRDMICAAGRLEIPEGIPDMLEAALDEDGVRRWFITGVATGLIIYSNDGFGRIKRRLKLA